MRRTALLRVLGLLVVAAVLAAATQLLLISFETDPLLSRSNTDDLVGWIRDRPREGAAMLTGVALAAIALWLLVLFTKGRRADRPTIVTRRSEGATRIDRTTLGDSITRSLASIDRRTEATASVGRRGRVNLHLVTPDPSRSGSTGEYTRALAELIHDRGLPCRSGRTTVSIPRRPGRRSTVR